MPDLTAIKTYAALAGAALSALLGVFAADSSVGKVITVLAVIATAVATYQAPRTLRTGEHVRGERGATDLVAVLVVVVLVLVVLLLLGIIPTR